VAKVRVIVEYEGTHNFEWDTALEALAGKLRDDAGMDIEAETRHMVFTFDDGAIGNQFVAAVHNVYPDFTVIAE
jgi:hypothetical protein